MTTPRSLMHGLFLSTALMLGAGIASAQSGLFGPETKRGKAVADKHQILNPVSNKTGFLYLCGQELHKETVANAKKRRRDIQKSFKEMPLEIVGNVDNPIAVDDIEAALTRLAAKHLDHIVIINIMHGQVKTQHLGDSTFRKENLMLNRDHEKDITAKNLYGMIGKEFAENPDLAKTDLTNIHLSCYGETALEAMHQLPPGTKSVIFSNQETPTFIYNEFDLFARAYDHLHHLSTTRGDSIFVLDQRKAVAAATMMAGTFFSNNYNEVSLLSLSADAPDTLKLDNRAFVLGPHRGTVTKPLDVMCDFLENYSEDDALDLLLPHDDAINPIDGADAVKMARVFRNVPKSYPSAYRDLASLTVILVALETDDPKLVRRSVDSAYSWGLFGREKPPTPQPKPAN